MGFSVAPSGSLGIYLLQQMEQAFQDIGSLAPEIQERMPHLALRVMMASQVREDIWRERQVKVPTIAFMAVTGECNLRCPHCYTQDYKRRRMTEELARRIVLEAYELGVSLIVVTGGEPLMHPEFFDIPREVPDMPFMVFSNGLKVPEFLKRRTDVSNLMWAISVDGPREYNDARRGTGSFDGAMSAMEALAARGLPFGFSSVLGADNVDAATDPEFVAALARKGCRAGIFLEQIPHPVCTPSLGSQIGQRLEQLRETAPIPLIGFPADEFRYGGCQGAGQGMIHISPEGMLEPCPAARISAD
ncbi:MAG: radical SAM protein, partial [Desulfobacterales bacterium]|nr:radical SAM protein [Desulfobacterales bacterium]